MATQVKQDGKAKDAGPKPPHNPTPPFINLEVFNQIRDMDDDDDDDSGEPGGHEFSRGIVWGFFEQAEGTFREMEEAIAESSLTKLSSLGHFLKGSSAALGIIKVQDSCEKMQHYGNLRDEEAGIDLSEKDALKRIQELLDKCKVDYEEAKEWMEGLYVEEA